MQQGAKVVLGLLAIGGVVALVMASGEKQAHAAPGGTGTAPPILPPILPPVPGSSPIPPQGGIVVVPPLPEVPIPPGHTEPGPGALPPVVVPPQPVTTAPPLASVPLPPMQLPSPFPTVPPPVVPGAPTTGTISLPGVGTFDPASGSVFDANGIKIGTFNPLTGVVTRADGSTIQLPGTGSQPAASLPSLPSIPTLPTPIQLPTQVITPGPEAPTTAPPDTVQVVTSMLDQELQPHWRIASPGLAAWQKARGLSADGAFGPGTALAMGKELGTLPIVRAWPKGSYLGSQHLPDYQTSLRQLAQSAPEPRRSQLMAAANREQGQGFGTPEKPIVNTITLHEV